MSHHVSTALAAVRIRSDVELDHMPGNPKFPLTLRVDKVSTVSTAFHFPYGFSLWPIYNTISICNCVSVFFDPCNSTLTLPSQAMIA